MKTTQDTLLNGAIQLIQPAEGYRAAIDPLFLAACIPVRPGESVLEIGPGVGTAMLALAHRVPDIRIIGLELQHSLVRLAHQNIKLNHFQERLDVLHGDLLLPPPRLSASSFSHIMVNPPYYEEETSPKSPHATKALANVEHTAPLSQWVDFCIRMVRPKGSITFIYTVDRLDDLLAVLQGRVGEITLFPLWPKTGKPAKRVLVRGRKGVKSGTRLLSGLVLHQADGAYTREANSILSDGMALDLT
jgi:tRNA1(Val) A37 N6-methylase TrmN6